MKNPVNRFSLKWSCVLHGLLLLCAVCIPLLSRSHLREAGLPPITVVWAHDIDSVPQPEPPTQPDAVPDPSEPADLPLPENPITVEQQEPSRQTPPTNTPFEKGPRVEYPSATPQPTPSVPRLTPEEIRKILGEDTSPTPRNPMTQDEVSRCRSLIRQALYGTWSPPGLGRPALLEIRLDASGKIVRYNITRSSGSTAFDNTVLLAAANCPPIRGLSVDFLKQHETLTVEFKLE